MSALSALKWSGRLLSGVHHIEEWLSTVPKPSGAWRAAIAAVTPPRFSPSQHRCRYVRPIAAFRYLARRVGSRRRQCQHQLAATAEDCDAFTRADVITPSTATGAMRPLRAASMAALTQERSNQIRHPWHQPSGCTTERQEDTAAHGYASGADV